MRYNTYGYLYLEVIAASTTSSPATVHEQAQGDPGSPVECIKEWLPGFDWEAAPCNEEECVELHGAIERGVKADALEVAQRDDYHRRGDYVVEKDELRLGNAGWNGSNPHCVCAEEVGYVWVCGPQDTRTKVDAHVHQQH